MADAIDAAESVAKLVGTTAQAALTIGNTALSILTGAQQVLAVVGLGFPPAAILASDLQVALPIIAAIARYAPAVQQGIEQNRPILEVVAGIGGELFDKLGNLAAVFPNAAIFGVAIEEFLKANEFTPQDPRFDRTNPAQF